MNWSDSGMLTVVVPIHGQIDTTIQFLEAYERQTVKPHLLFVDDRSPDDSVMILRNSGYDVYVPDERLWFNGALQKSIDECRTPLLGFLNNDIVFGKDFFEKVISTFDVSGYDFLVPQTVDVKEYDYFERDRPFKVSDLIIREGWCMFMRVEPMRKLPPIPDVFKLNYGDDWITYHAWTANLKVGKMEHIFIHHETSRTISAYPSNSNPQIARELEAFNDEFQWLRRRRKRPQGAPEQRYSVDPASGQLLKINLRTKDSDPSTVCTGDGWPALQKIEPKNLGSLVLVVPIAMIHERFRERFAAVVQKAWEYSPGPFSSMKIEFVEDKDRQGAGWGRNVGMDRNPEADWYFFLDVDDLPKPFCFEAMNRANADIVWGVIEHRTQADAETFMVVDERSFGHYGWDELVTFGHRGGSGFNTAFFIRGPTARSFRWFERTPVFEDVEYFILTTAHAEYERLKFPLVTIDKTVRKPVDGGSVQTKDADLVWFNIMKFWQNHGRDPLTQEVIQYRNSCQTIKDFYG